MEPSASPRSATPHTQNRVGSYRFVRLLAEGGMGQVYEVQHVELGRRAALKMVRPELASDEGVAERFFTEARAMSLVEHPSLVHVYEFGHLTDGSAYIVMEYVEGETLREQLDRRGGKLIPIHALILARQMAAALQAAHVKGVIHRDLKPENIKVTESDESSVGSRVKIFDFGIAKMLDAGQGPQRAQTRPGQIIGTPSYMAPEQAGAPGGVGAHTDVYALGAMLFEMLGGQPPFVSEDGIEVVRKHLFAEPPRLGSVLPDADPEIEELIGRMLCKKPEERPGMREVKAQLGEIIKRISAPKTQSSVPADGPVPDSSGDDQSALPELATIVLAPTRTNAATIRVASLPRQQSEEAPFDVTTRRASSGKEPADALAETRLGGAPRGLRESAFARLQLYKGMLLAKVKGTEWRKKPLFVGVGILLGCSIALGTRAVLRTPRPGPALQAPAKGVPALPPLPARPQAPSASSEPAGPVAAPQAPRAPEAAEPARKQERTAPDPAPAAAPATPGIAAPSGASGAASPPAPPREPRPQRPRAIDSEAAPLLAAAEKAYQQSFFERAAFLAERTKNAEPLASWELIGRAACGLRNPARASIAYVYLKRDAAYSQALIRACARHGFAFSKGIFKPR